MAALALTFAACSNDNYDAAQPAKGEGIPFTATISIGDGATTRALSESGTKLVASWAVGEKVALIHNSVSDEMEVSAVNNGVATITGTITGSPSNGDAVTVIYPSTAAEGTTGDVKPDLLYVQEGGTLPDVASKYDVRKGTGTLKVSGTASLNGNVSLANQFAIFKFTTRNAAGSADINVKPLTVTIGEEAYVITPASATSELYAALPAVSGRKFFFSATGSDSKIYAYSKDDVSFDKGKFYQSTLKMTEVVPEAVDLGLSVRWANMNVGATSESDYGKYYAWGETTGYTGSDTSHSFDWASYKFTTDGGSSFTKYTGSDNKTTLEAADDAATAKWGGDWRMPTKVEYQELLANTDKQWVNNYNNTGVSGYKFTSKTDASKSIFLPAAGVRDGTSLVDRGSYGYYWSSSLSGENPGKALSLYFNSGYAIDFGDGRCSGFSVRPVQGDPDPAVPMGALSGKFSVSDTKKVYFSQGNLQYDGTNWKFADNQWDVLGANGTKADGTATSYPMDLFTWGNTSSSTEWGGTSYYTEDADLSGTTDWGSNIGEGWRTLTGGSGGEWEYLFNTRTVNGGTGEGKSYTLGQSVEGVPGVVLYPDDYTGEVYTTAQSANWSDFESAGCVFLPAAGDRNGTSVNNVGSYGNYWSGTAYGTVDAYGVGFGSGSVGPAGSNFRDYGFSVRLVRPVQP